MTTSHLGTDWRDQWERVLRWHQRLDVIRRALPPDGPDKTRALDDVYAFFMNCFHLGDWIWNSGVKTPDEVRDFIASDPDLNLCRDVCNGLKHFRVIAARASADANWSTATRQTAIVTVGGSRRSRLIQPHGVWWVITTSSGDRDMFETADRCVGAWRHFLEI